MLRKERLKHGFQTRARVQCSFMLAHWYVRPTLFAQVRSDFGSELCEFQFLFIGYSVIFVFLDLDISRAYRFANCNSTSRFSIERTNKELEF